MKTPELKLPERAENVLCLQRTQYRDILEKLWVAEMESLLLDIKPALPEVCTSFLDIGAGLAGIDALVGAHYFAKSHIWPSVSLLDKNSVDLDKSKIGYHQSASTFGFYSDMAAATAVLTSVGVPETLISTAPTEETGRHYELIMSFLSWGFHYPIYTYLHLVEDRLVPGGVLIVDVRKGTGGEELLDQQLYLQKQPAAGGGRKHDRLVYKKL